MKLGQSTTSFEVADLPIVPASIRAALLFTNMKRTLALPTPFFKTQKGSGWGLFWRLVRLNWKVFAMEMCLSTAAAVLYYVPALFLQKVVTYLESDPEGSNKAWGVILALGLFVFNALGFLGKFSLPVPGLVFDCVPADDSYWTIVEFSFSRVPRPPSHPA